MSFKVPFIKFTNFTMFSIVIKLRQKLGLNVEFSKLTEDVRKSGVL
jgi:hypothetical protein